MNISWFQELVDHNANENTPKEGALHDTKAAHASHIESNASATIISIKHQVGSWHQYMQKHFHSEHV